ncbi:hypothetical protein CKO22_10340 [Thiococcus pfennigii]|nr:hypothetical protein [Thiococcus pfennigii]
MPHRGWNETRIRMNELPRQTLRELILYHGRALCEDPRRCEALLKDHCGQHKREIAVLMAALRDQIPRDLLHGGGGTPPSLLQARLVRRLYDNLGIAEVFAAWAVESWMLALGLPVANAAPDDAPSQSPISAGGTVLAGRYRDQGDGTVTDLATGLQWMRAALGQRWTEPGCSGEAERHPWSEVLAAAERFNQARGAAGHADWRVPTIDELRTLIYCSGGRPRLWNDTGNECQGQFDRPTIYLPAFPNTPRAAFWSASPDASDPAYAWLVYFSNGQVNYGYKDRPACIRLVRGGTASGRRASKHRRK